MARLRMVLFIALMSGWANPASAQFLRLGPLDFGAILGLEGVYTTNVEQERESEATEEMEDYYGIVSFELDGSGDIGPSTRLDLQTGIAIERHVNRPDLDNSENPFGQARIEARSDFGRLSLSAYAGYENTSESADDVFVPGGKKKRDVRSVYEYGGGVKWERNPFLLSATYDFESERHEDEEFQDGDIDTTTLDYLAGWKVAENLGLSYELKREKNELVNDPAAEEDWRDTETILVDWKLQIIERPSVTYSFGLEKEDTEDEEGEWEPVHRLSITDTRDISPTLSIDGSAQYNYEDDPEEDDIGFTYSVGARHTISPTAEQSLRFTREPVDTFGSTTETDATRYEYKFTKEDLFIYNLTLELGVTFEINEPLGGGPTEEIWKYEAALWHITQLTRQWSRQLRYEYSLEENNLIDEPLEEHRVSLLYQYTF